MRVYFIQKSCVFHCFENHVNLSHKSEKAEVKGVVKKVANVEKGKLLPQNSSEEASRRTQHVEKNAVYTKSDTF